MEKKKKRSTKFRKCRVPDRINPRRNRPRHTVIKMTKIKEQDKILKATRGKMTTYKGTLIGLY